jgi:hypothetical protein
MHAIMKNIQLKKTIILTTFGVVLGAIAGFLYWNFVGCSNGHCLIQSVWYNSTIYGAVMGGLLVNLFIKNNS